MIEDEERYGLSDLAEDEQRYGLKMSEENVHLTLKKVRSQRTSPNPLPLISPSQIGTFLDCPRKWGWQKINKLRSPSTPAQQLGTDTHQELEDYYVLQRAPNPNTKPGRLASRGLHLLPQRNDPTVRTERKFRFKVTYAEYNGIQDLGYHDKKHRLHVVHDHKTTSNAKYIKTPEVLSKDPQAIIYAFNFFLEHSDEYDVLLRWMYLFTKGTKEPVIVELIVTRKYIEWAFKEFIDPVGKAIAHARLTYKDAKELPVNVRSCSNYGGCEFQNLCNISTQERAIALMTDAPKSPAELLASLQGTAAAPAAPIAGFAGAVQAAQEPQAPPAPPAAAINPPPAAYQPPKAEPAPQTVQAPPPQAAPAPQPTQAPAPTPLVVQAPPQNPGEQNAVAAAELMPTVDQTPEKPKRRGRPPATEGAAPVTRKKSFTLYVDCLPQRGKLPTDSQELIEQAALAVASSNSVADYRLIEFNKGFDLVNVTLDAMFANEAPTGEVFIRGDSKHLDPFMKAATKVVRAIR